MQFIDLLEDQEKRDYEKAKVIHDMREAEDERLELENSANKASRRKVVQNENFAKLKVKEFESQLIVKRAQQIAADANFMASARMPDTI